MKLQLLVQTLNFSRLIRLNCLARIWIKGARAPWLSIWLLITVVSEDAKRNWNWWKNRFFSHIFFIGGISVWEGGQLMFYCFFSKFKIKTMPAVANSLKKDTPSNKISKKKLNSYKFISDIAESNFTMTSHWKLVLIYSTLCFPEP